MKYLLRQLIVNALERSAIGPTIESRTCIFFVKTAEVHYHAHADGVLILNNATASGPDH